MLSFLKRHAYFIQLFDNIKIERVGLQWQATKYNTDLGNTQYFSYIYNWTIKEDESTYWNKLEDLVSVLNNYI